MQSKACQSRISRTCACIAHKTEEKTRPRTVQSTNIHQCVHMLPNFECPRGALSSTWAGHGGICPATCIQSDSEKVCVEFKEAANARAHHLTRTERKNCRNGCRGWRYSPVRRCSCVPPLTASCSTVSPHDPAVPSGRTEPVTTSMDLVFGLRLVPARGFELLRELARERRFGNIEPSEACRSP